MTVQPIKDDAYSRPAEVISGAAVLGIRGGGISHPEKQLSARDCFLPNHARLDYKPRRVPRETTSYADEHIRMKPVMEQVRKTRLFEPVSAGFRLYCTRRVQPPQPVGKRTFSGSRSLVVTATWKWNHEQEKIIGLEVSLAHRTDLAWARKKIQTIFKKASMPMLPIALKE